MIISTRQISPNDPGPICDVHERSVGVVDEDVWSTELHE